MKPFASVIVLLCIALAVQAKVGFEIEIKTGERTQSDTPYVPGKIPVAFQKDGIVIEMDTESRNVYDNVKKLVPGTKMQMNIMTKKEEEVKTTKEEAASVSKFTNQWAPEMTNLFDSLTDSTLDAEIVKLNAALKGFGDKLKEQPEGKWSMTETWGAKKKSQFVGREMQIPVGDAQKPFFFPETLLTADGDTAEAYIQVNVDATVKQYMDKIKWCADQKPYDNTYTNDVQHNDITLSHLIKYNMDNYTHFLDELKLTDDLEKLMLWLTVNMMNYPASNSGRFKNSQYVMAKADYKALGGIKKWKDVIKKLEPKLSEPQKGQLATVKEQSNNYKKVPAYCRFMEEKASLLKTKGDAGKLIAEFRIVFGYLKLKLDKLVLSKETFDNALFALSDIPTQKKAKKLTLQPNEKLCCCCYEKGTSAQIMRKCKKKYCQGVRKEGMGNLKDGKSYKEGKTCSAVCG